MFEFKSVILMDPVHVNNRTGFEDGVELYRHAEAAKHHVSVAVLGAECLVGDFKTRGAVDGAVNPGHLQTVTVIKVYIYIKMKIHKHKLFGELILYSLHIFTI